MADNKELVIRPRFDEGASRQAIAGMQNFGKQAQKALAGVAGQGQRDQGSLLSMFDSQNQRKMLTGIRDLQNAIKSYGQDLRNLDKVLADVLTKQQNISRISGVAIPGFGPQNLPPPLPKRKSPLQRLIEREEEDFQRMGGGRGGPPGIPSYVVPGGPGGPGGPSTPGGGSGGGGDKSGRRDDAMLIATAVAGAVGRVMQNAGGFFQSQKNYELNNVAGMQQATSGRFINRLMSGDLSDVWALQSQAMRGDGKRFGTMMDERHGGQGLAQLQAVGQGLGGIAQIGTQAALIAGTGGAGAAAGMGRAVSAGQAAGGIGAGAMDILGAGASLFRGGTDLAEVQTLMGALDAQKASSPAMMAAMDMIMAEKHMRAGASRKLMGRHMAAAGTGIGFGYGRGESFEFAEAMQRSGGMAGMFGSSGTRQRQTGLSAADLKSLGIPIGPSQGSFIQLPGEGAQVGAPGGVQPGAIVTERFKTGRGRLEEAMRLAGAGIDRGTAMGAVDSTFQALGGGRNKQAMDQTVKVLEDAVFRGTQKGFTDPRTQEELVGALAQASQGAVLSGTEGLRSMSAFLTGGGESGMTLAGTSARRQVLGNLDQLFAQNPYFQSVGLSQAKGILGGGGNLSSGTMQVLGGASSSQLLTGGQRFEDWGISRGQRMDALKGRVMSELKFAGSMNPELAAAIEASGGDFSKISEKELRKGLQLTKSFGGSDQLSLQGAKMFRSMGDLSNVTTNQEGKLKQYMDSAAQASISTEEKTKMALEKLVPIMTRLADLVDPEKMIQAQAEKEKKGQNFDLSAGKMFVVEIIRSVDSVMSVQPGKK